MALAVISTYYVERVEGIRSLRPLLGFLLVLAFWGRALLLSGVARSMVREMWEGAELSEDSGRPVQVFRTASVVAAGLFGWCLLLVGVSLLGPFAVPLVLPLLCIRGAVAPSWLARAGIDGEGGTKSFLRAVNDNSGRRAIGLATELLILLAIEVVAINLYASIFVFMLLGRSVLGLDVAFVESFLSSRNMFVLLSLGALVLVLFEPLRVAVSASAYVESRIRQRGLDLRAAVDEAIQAADRRGPALTGQRTEAPPSRLLGKASIVFVGVLVAAWPVPTQGQEPSAELTPLPPGMGPDGVAPPRSDEPTGSGMPPKLPEHFVADTFESLLEDTPTLREFGTSDDRTVRDDLQEIMAQDEFREFDDERGQSVRTAITRFFDWLFRPRPAEPMVREGGGPGLPMPPAGVFVAMAGALLLLVIFYLLFTRARERSQSTSAGEVLEGQSADPRERPPEAHLDDAAGLAAASDYRAAFRALYLATLVALDRQRLISFDPALTNWQYIRPMPRGDKRSDFTAFTRLFDYKWYGDEPTTEEDYRRGRALADRICRGADGLPATQSRMLGSA